MMEKGLTKAKMKAVEPQKMFAPQKKSAYGLREP